MNCDLRMRLFRRCNFAKYLLLGYDLLENLIYSYSIFYSSKIVCVFAQFGEKLSWKILMYSSKFCLSWEIYMCSCNIFSFPEMKYVFSWKIHLFSYYIQATWKIWCVLEIALKRSLLEKKNRYKSKIARRHTTGIRQTYMSICFLFLYW